MINSFVWTANSSVTFRRAPLATLLFFVRIPHQSKIAFKVFLPALPLKKTANDRQTSSCAMDQMQFRLGKCSTVRVCSLGNEDEIASVQTTASNQRWQHPLFQYYAHYRPTSISLFQIVQGERTILVHYFALLVSILIGLQSLLIQKSIPSDFFMSKMRFVFIFRRLFCCFLDALSAFHHLFLATTTSVKKDEHT